MGTNFYAYTEACECCGRGDEPLHIGKSSAGWKFSFQGYPDHDPPLTSWKAWREFLVNLQIRDEYGGTITLEELQEWVANKFHSNNCQTCFVKAQAYSRWNDYHDPEGHPFNDGEFS